MTTTTFNPLEYFEELKAAGMPEQQAKVQADTLNKIIDGKLATKNDIVSLKRDIKELEYKLTIRMGSMVIASSMATIAILGFLMKFGH
jgi:hypothetical protein